MRLCFLLLIIVEPVRRSLNLLEQITVLFHRILGNLIRRLFDLLWLLLWSSKIFMLDDEGRVDFWSAHFGGLGSWLFLL